MAVAEARTRWRHEMHGEDPDSPEIVWQDVLEHLQRAFELARQSLEKEGLTEKGCCEPPASLAELRMKKLGLSYMNALVQLGRSLSDNEDLANALQAGITLTTKLSRVGSQLDRSRTNDVWDWDTVPNLLLMEILDGQIAAELERVAGAARLDLERFRQARCAVVGVVGPLIAAVPAGARLVIARLVAAGTAPSPFLCVE